MASEVSTNEELEAKIDELNGMISLQQDSIDGWRERYEQQKVENDGLKLKLKELHSIEQENITLNARIVAKNGIIDRQNKIIYHLRNPTKWQWLDFEGYLWKDFTLKLSIDIDTAYLNEESTFRHELPSNHSDGDQMFEFRFNADRQRIDNQRHTLRDDGKSNEDPCSDSVEAMEFEQHKMTRFGGAVNVYFVQRVPVDHDTNYFVDPSTWTGPARKTFGDRIMTLYHVTDKYAADIINKTRTMKCGQIGRFGGGIYFAEKITTAQRRAHHKGYVITARVLVGREFIIEKNSTEQFDGALCGERLMKKGFDSVYAAHWTERVVYHCDQVCVDSIKKMSSFKSKWSLFG